MEGRCCWHRSRYRPTCVHHLGARFQTAEPVNIKNFEEQEEYVYSDFLKEHGIVSLTNVPVLIEGAAWGVLEVDSTVPRDFSEDTTDFLTAAAAMIGTFVLSATMRDLYEEARLDGRSG